ncbi:MAG: hypothetical protein IJM66_11480 [Muribaculaceae bacterium]|nr:hypothetical protein [Muribaculaceae bacterium]MBQ6649453.1 hypothetical protein [Muribaculaceae bacterium]
MRTECVSVRLESLFSISEKAYKAVAFDGTEAIIPKSQVFGRDYDVIKSEAWWISAWILEKKELQYSDKKRAWFDNESRERLPNIIVEKHRPERVTPKGNNIINNLKK